MKGLWAPFDFLMAGFVVVVTIAQMLVTRPKVVVKSRGLVVLDSSYSLDQVRDRELLWSIVARGCDGFFDHVWSVHPMVGAADPEPSVGPLRIEELCGGHTFVEAHLSTDQRWSFWPVTSFALSQRRLFGYLRKLVASGGVSAIRVGDPYYLGLLGYLLSRSSGLPLTLRVASDYDAAYEKTGMPAYPRLLRSRRIEKRIERFILRRAKLIVAPNIAYQSFAVANGARPECCAIVPFGGLLHPAHFDEPSDRPSVRTEAGLGQRPLVVSVMRLEPVKHAADLVDILDLVRRDCPDVACAVVGDGSQRGEMLTRVDRLNLGDSFFLLGNKSQRWIASILANADVVVAPMMGRALVEAALSGTPIVAYDTDWHGELIDDGVTGILVPHGDLAAMASAVCELLTQRESGKIMGELARRRAMDSMSRNTVMEAEREAWVRLVPHLACQGSAQPLRPDKTERVDPR